MFWSFRFAFGWDMPFSGSFALVVVKVEFCTGLPSSTWSMLVVSAFASLAVAEVVVLISVHHFQYVGEAVWQTLAFAALSKVWSYASATACGFRSGQASSHCAVSGRRRIGRQRRPMKQSSGGPLHISIFFRGLLVI
jgi:hypothetical protein